MGKRKNKTLIFHLHFSQREDQECINCFGTGIIIIISIIFKEALKHNYIRKKIQYICTTRTYSLYMSYIQVMLTKQIIFTWPSSRGFKLLLGKKST